MFRFACLIIFTWCSPARAQQTSYAEQHRPQFHFSPPSKWMNDPNGMVYYGGEYHLFYQHYPDSTIWGPMHWGHAVSTNLVNWKNLPIALYPDSLGLIFSGSVVVDSHNTSGLKEGRESPLVALYTYHDMVKEKAGKAADFQYQGMAYSLDKGRTWKKYAQNPVVKNNGYKDFRDPKVFWHPSTRQWIMVLAVADHVEFYQSKNLKEWHAAGTFGQKEGGHGGVWECPDLFEMKVTGTNSSKWVLIVSIGNGGPNGGSATQYFTGQFTGTAFVNDNTPETVLWLDYGPDNYAGVTWSNTGSKKLFLGWMSNWNYAQVVPTKSWRSAMTVPRELHLEKTPAGYRLAAHPVPSLASLRTKKQLFKTGTTLTAGGLTETILSIDLSKTTATNFGIEVFNDHNEKLLVGFDKKQNEFYIDRSQAGDHSFSALFTQKAVAPRLLHNTVLKMRLLVDHSSVELFADDGTVLLTSVFFPGRKLTSMRIYQDKNKVSVLSSTVYLLRSIW